MTVANVQLVVDEAPPGLPLQLPFDHALSDDERTLLDSDRIKNHTPTWLEDFYL